MVAQRKLTLPNNSFFKVLQNRPFMAAVVLTLFLYVLEEGFLAPRHVLYLWILRRYDAPALFRLVGLAEIFLTFLIVILFLWLSFRSRIKVRVLYFLVFSIAILVQYNYWNTLHRFLTVADLNTARNSPPACG